MNKKLLVLLSAVGINLFGSGDLFAMGDGLPGGGGAATDIADRLGKTALHRAVEAGNVATVLWLIRRGAKVNLANRFNDETTLHMAISVGDSVTRLEIIRVLLGAGAGASVNLANRFNGETPLHMAISVRDSVAKLEIIQVLLDAGANMNVRDFSGVTPLIYAVETGDVASVEALLSFNADGIELCDKYNNTPLTMAVLRDDSAMVDMLLAFHANPNVCNCVGNTPLICAVKINNLEVVRALIGTTDVDIINALSIDGRTALDYAREEDMLDIVEVLTAAGAVAGERPVFDEGDESDEGDEGYGYPRW